MSQTAYREKRTIEWLMFAFLAGSLALVSYFHEPWFDEAQAWQIARCATLKEILFEIPHYEGHPALWHLMLLAPAKLGFPYELSLGVISFAATVLAGWLILFKSPFPKFVRCILPFHYFIFYQNGVIARPYGYMFLALLLMAITFQERNERPWRFVLSMAFLCSLSGYGIVLAGGVAAAWLYEICAEKRWKLFDFSFWRDKRIVALTVLLAIAVLLMLQIMPYPNTFAFSIDSTNAVWICLLYSFFAMLPDSTLMNILPCEGMPKFSGIDSGQLISAIFVGIVFLLFINWFSAKKNRLYFWIPYILFSVFTSFVYFSAHHLGIILSFVIFFLWIAAGDSPLGEIFHEFFSRMKLSSKDVILIKKAGIALGLLPVIVPFFWTVIASYHEVRYDYFNSKSTAEFLRKHGLENAGFLVEWGEVISEDWNEEEFFERVNAYGLDVSINPVSVMPYFDHNFCLNLNLGQNDKAYNLHRFANADESRAIFERLRDYGAPDAIIGLIDLSKIYGDEVSMHDYVPVYKITPRYVNVWKFFRPFSDSYKSRYIYLREDLLEKYGVERIYE